MTMTDRELLELAAKAAAFEIVGISDDGMAERADGGWWNPLEDDGDSLRLAFILKMDVAMSCDCCQVSWWTKDRSINWVNEKTEDFKLAIVRAAAEIGKSMEKTQ